MERIDILMATYNGERYVARQIRSLQDQTYEDWVLWVHDDGSADHTVGVVRRMAESDRRIRLVEDGICLHTPAWNFMHLLAWSEAEYTMFCDQDDIWLENKLEALMEVMRGKDQHQPQAVYGNGYMYKADTGEISGRALLSTPTQLGDALFANGGVQGCAILMNRALREICLDPPPVLCMHDHLVTLAALTFGTLTYVDRPLMLYRRHEEAVTDVSSGTYKEKAVSFLQGRRAVLDRRHLDAIHAFVEHYRERIPSDKLALYESFFSLESQSRWRALGTVLHRPFTLYGSKNILLLKILLRPLLAK